MPSSQLKYSEDFRPRPSVAEPIPHAAANRKDTDYIRWNLPDRVEGWTSSGLNVEFGYAGCRRAWKNTLLQAVSGFQDQTALDIGSGPGIIAQLWAELGFVTFGVDSAPSLVEAARRAASVKELDITFLEGDAEDPPFAGQSFDVISSRFVLFTLAHPGYAMRRWVEMLRPEGRLVLIGHEPAGYDEMSGDQVRATRIDGPANSIDEQNSDDPHELAFSDHTPRDLRAVMEAAGLRDIERISVDALVAARAELQRRTPSINLPRSIPFILVGRK